ncbi:sulfurtransferase [Paucibacter sp. AS339]|uniref:sulfurtransferase n=1 Tax=Paucibacter hankyongi TaxID=3133434 RepID=UPI0030A14BCF
MPFQTLISSAELHALGAAPLLIDVSFDLSNTEAGETAYQQSHLPGAHYLHLDRDLSSKKIDDEGRFKGRHPLPQREQFALRMQQLGLNKGQQVVAYDGQGGMYAARLWWMLRWLGHAPVAVLDGGLQVWQASGGAMNSETPPSRVGDFQAAASLVEHVSADQLQAQLGQVRLIDARAPERFRGEVEPLDNKAGHIPGASNRLFKNNLQADGRFKPAEVLRAEWEALLAPFNSAQVVHQCGSGVTACHNLLAMQYAGLVGSQLYPGSWSEWSSDPTRPVAIG